MLNRKGFIYGRVGKCDPLVSGGSLLISSLRRLYLNAIRQWRMPFALSRLSSEPQRSRTMGLGLGGGYESPSSSDSDDSCDTIRVSIHSGRASATTASRAGSPHFTLCPDLDDEPSSPLLGPTRWWDSDSGRRRRRRDNGFSFIRRLKRRLVRLARHPLVPTQPVTIVSHITLKSDCVWLLTNPFSALFACSVRPLCDYSHLIPYIPAKSRQGGSTVALILRIATTVSS